MVPVIKAIRKESDVLISVVPGSPRWRRRRSKLGADIVNDITGFLGNPKMAAVVGA